MKDTAARVAADGDGVNISELAYQSATCAHGVRVYLTLRDSIGAALSEKRLAEEYGVSRTPVREAFIKLAEDGLVRIVPQSGTFVSLIDLAAVHDSQLIREALECATVFLAAQRVVPAEADELAEILDRQRMAAANGDHAGFIAGDDALHARLIEMSGRPGVLKTVREAKLHLDRVRYLTVEETPHIAEIIAQHTAIVDRVVAHDSRGARKVMREHLRMLEAKLDQLTLARPVMVNGELPARRRSVRR
jgi:DNA-binding GntR family transcriptional regulator